MKTKTKYQTKKRKTQRQRRVELILMTAFIIGVGIIGYSIKQVEADIKPTEMAIYKQEEKPKELSMKEWVLNEFKINGLNTEVADCVIQNESGWQDQKVSPDGKDFGLMQWNIQHIRSGLITPKCIFDYKCAVKKAIAKIKKDKGWFAWMAYFDRDCKRFGKTFN